MSDYWLIEQTKLFFHFDLTSVYLFNLLVMSFDI